MQWKKNDKIVSKVFNRLDLYFEKTVVYKELAVSFDLKSSFNLVKAQYKEKRREKKKIFWSCVLQTLILLDNELLIKEKKKKKVIQ